MTKIKKLSKQQQHRRSRRQGFLSIIKARTIAVVTIGLALVIEFSTEIYMYSALHNENNDYASLEGYLRNRVGPSQHQEEDKIRPASNRNGFLSKGSLRTNSRVIHDSTPWIIAMIQRQETSIVSNHPRVVAFGESLDSIVSFERKERGHRSTRTVDPMGRIWNDAEDERDFNQPSSPDALEYEQLFLEECTPILEMPQLHPTCNSFHELRLDSDIDLVSTKGSWRTVWKTSAVPSTGNGVSFDQNNTDVVALKMLNFNREFNDESFSAHGMDAMVMDRLTASPHVIDAHSFCGNSVITEFASSGGRDQIKSYDIRNRERLRIARDLAKGLADVQSLRHLKDSTYNADNVDSKTTPVAERVLFAHNDINIANTVYVNGKIKWNDFNIGILMRRSIENSTINCGAPVKFRSDLWRSPEEVRNETYIDLEKTDMYGFGNILYQVMTRHQPWTHKEPGRQYKEAESGKLALDEIAERKRAGHLPTIPEQYKNTTKPELQTLTIATVSCYHPKPSKRPSAIELARGLSVLYDRIKKKRPVNPKLIYDLFVK